MHTHYALVFSLHISWSIHNSLKNTSFLDISVELTPSRRRRRRVRLCIRENFIWLIWRAAKTTAKLETQVVERERGRERRREKGERVRKNSDIECVLIPKWAKREKVRERERWSDDSGCVWVIVRPLPSSISADTFAGVRLAESSSINTSLFVLSKGEWRVWVWVWVWVWVHGWVGVTREGVSEI